MSQDGTNPHAQSLYGTNVGKRGLLQQGKLKNLYSEPVNQSESDVFKMKSRIRSNNPNYITGKSMVELRQTSRQHQYQQPPPSHPIYHNNLHQKQNKQQLNARSQSFRIKDEGLNSRNILANQINHLERSGGEKEELVSFADMELVSKEHEKLHQLSHADSYLPIINGDQNLSRHHLGTFYTSYSSKLQKQKKKSQVNVEIPKQIDNTNTNDQHQFDQMKNMSFNKYSNVGKQNIDNESQMQNPLIGFQDQIKLLEFSYQENELEFEKTQSVNFRRKNEAKNHQKQIKNTQQNYSKRDPSYEKKHQYKLISQGKDSDNQPQNIYGDIPKLTNIMVDKTQASQISTDRSKIFDSKKVSTLKMNSRASDASYKFQNTVKDKKPIGDVNITIYKDLLSQRTQPINDQSLNNQLSPNIWYSNMESNSQAYESTNPALISQQHQQTQIQSQNNQNTNQTLQESTRILNNQSCSLNTSHQVSQMQPALNQQNLLLQKNHQIISNKEHIASKGSQRKIEQNLKRSKKSQEAIFDLAKYKNKVFHSLSQGIAAKQDIDLEEALEQTLSNDKMLEQSMGKLHQKSKDEQTSQGYKFSMWPNTYVVDSRDNIINSFHYHSNSVRPNKKNSCINTQTNLNMSLVQARKNRSQRDIKFNKSLGAAGGNGLEKQLRSWLYGHYHIQLQNQIKQQRDIPSYGEIVGNISYRGNQKAKYEQSQRQIDSHTYAKMMKMEGQQQQQQLNQNVYFKNNLQGIAGDNFEKQSSNQLILTKDKVRIEEMRRHSNAEYRQPLLISLTTSPPQGKIHYHNPKDDQNKVVPNMVSISSDNLRKINQRVSKENDFIQTIDGNLYLQNGFQIFENSQLGASSITPTIHFNINQASEQQLLTYQIYAKEQNLESAENIFISKQIQNEHLLKQLSNSDEKLDNSTIDNQNKFQQQSMQQLYMQQWQSPYKKHKQSQRRLNRGQVSGVINSDYITGGTGTNEQNTSEVSLLDHHTMIQRTLRANCQRINLKRKSYKTQKIKMEIKGALEGSADDNDKEDTMHDNSHQKLMSYVKYDNTKKITEQEDKSLQMNQSPLKTYSVVKLGLTEPQQKIVSQSSLGEFKSEFNYNDEEEEEERKIIYQKVQNDGRNDSAIDFGFSPSFRYSHSNTHTLVSKDPSRMSFRNNNSINAFNPIPLAQKIYLGSGEKNDRKVYSSLSNTRTPKQNEIYQFPNIIPLMDRIDNNMSLNLDDEEIRTNQQLISHNIEMLNQDRSNMTLNDLSILVPINQRPNRRNMGSEKKQKISMTFKKNKASLNSTHQMMMMPPKPPTRKENSTPVENETITLMQHHIQDLKNKILDLESKKPSELKNGIQKDEHFYSNLQELTQSELKTFLINQIYDIRETKKSFFESSTKIKQLLHDLQTGKDYSHLREQLCIMIENRYSQMNFELLYIETKRDLERLNLQFSHLKNKTEQLKQQAYGNANMSKEYKLKLQRQTDLNSKQHKTILSQNKINSEKSLKVESLLQSVFTLTQEEEVLKTSKFKEEIVLKRTINFLLRENFELKKHCRIKDSYLESAQSEINRLKTKVNRLMLKIEEDNNINKNGNNNITNSNNANSSLPPSAFKKKYVNQLNNHKYISVQPAAAGSKIQNDIAHILQSQKVFMDGQIQSNVRSGSPNQMHPTSPKNTVINNQLAAAGQNSSHKSNQNSAGSMFDFEILSTGNVFNGGKQDYNRTEHQIQTQPSGLLSHLQDDDISAARVLSRMIIDNFDLDYRIKLMMDNKEQDLNEELVDGSKQKFIEITMSCQPLVHKERVDFLAKNYLSFKRLGERLNSIVKILTLNELYTYIDNNKEIRMSSVDDIVGYVLNNQQDLITGDLQKYIQYYQSISSFSVEEKFFNHVNRKSAILLPVKDYDTGMPLGVLEIVNSNSGLFDLDCQYMSFMIADFAGFVINSLNNEIRRRKAEHSRTLLNQYAVKIFSQNKLSDLNKISCEAIKEMLSTDKVKFCFIQESLVELNDYEIIAFSQNYDLNNIDEETYKPEKKDSTFTKYKTQNYFGIMGSVMQQQQPTIIWNPKNDDRYNELIDMKTENPMYCFPLLDQNKVTSERRVVGCVQFENLQLRLLKGTQTIQQQQNSANSSLLIDEHLKALMKEFSSYIAEVLKIIRNQKLLKKFKSFILRAQENEHEHEHEHDNMLTNGDLSNRIQRQESHNSAVNTNSKDYQTPSVARLRLSAQIKETKLEPSKGLQLNFNNPRINIHEDVMMSARLINKKEDSESQTKKKQIRLPLQQQKQSLAPQNQLTIKKNANFALLKQMTKVSQQKTKEKDGMFNYSRKPSAVAKKQHDSPDRLSNKSNLHIGEHMIKRSPKTQKNIFTATDAKTRNHIDELMRQTQNSAFESESIQDTDEIVSFQRESNRKMKIIENSRLITSTDLMIDNL